ncbi:MAG: PAS domain S-box protein [Actinomycetota bacterium]|nr:PAS domain S-box protein [Actinomycetota bacterium]
MRTDPPPPAYGSSDPSDPLRLVFEHLPLALWTTDRELRFTSSIGAGLEALGLGPGSIEGVALEEVFGPNGGGPDAIGAHRLALEGGSSSYEETRASQTFRIHVEPLRDPRGMVVGTAGIALDVTERKRTEQTLRQVMHGYRAIAELTSDFAYSIRVLGEGDLHFEWVTEGFEQLTGFDRHEANAMGLLNVVHPDDLEATERALTAILLGETVTIEYRIVTRAGESKWVRGYGMPEVDDGGVVVRIFGAVQDITAQKAGEEDLSRTMDQLRRTDRERLRLLVHLVRAQEEERKRIADGIHDDSIQMMATVGLHLEALARKLEDPLLRREAEVLQGMVDDTVGRMRTLLFELAPPALRDEGLGVAIEQLLQRIADEHEERMAFSVHNRLTRELPEEVRLLVFRLAQEALSNVRKHAKASNVEVDLDERDGGVLLVVSDDGVGFSPSEPPQPGHVGLVAMRERAEMARGWWRLESEPGAGTTVRVWFPLTEELDAASSG